MFILINKILKFDDMKCVCVCVCVCVWECKYLIIQMAAMNWLSKLLRIKRQKVISFIMFMSIIIIILL